MPTSKLPAATQVPEPVSSGADADARLRERPGEIGGREGPEPTRYGDWEKDGRCIDF